MPAAPSVAIVTPSFNQARFIRQAIDSVLAQDDREIDYLVVDAGSTDGTLEILRSYGERLRWISEPDQGQADAIAKGFARTRGDILTWINSDDALLPGAVEKTVAAFRAHPEVGLVYANGLLLDESGRSTGLFPWIEPFDLWRLVYFSDYILQPAAFFRRSTYEEVGGLDTDLHFAMDWDLWIRLAGRAGVLFLADETLGCSRVWEDTKTSTGGWRRIRELGRLARRHTGRTWTPAVQRYALDTLGRELRRRLPSPLLRLAGAVGALVDHRILRRMPAHADGWLGPRGELLFPRRWRRARLELELPRLPPSGAARVTVAVDGGPSQLRSLGEPGTIVFELSAPDSSRGADRAPFCRVEVRSDFALRDRTTRRRLALRLVRIEPLD